MRHDASDGTLQEQCVEGGLKNAWRHSVLTVAATAKSRPVFQGFRGVLGVKCACRVAPLTRPLCSSGRSLQTRGTNPAAAPAPPPADGDRLTFVAMFVGFTA